MAMISIPLYLDNWLELDYFTVSGGCILALYILYMLYIMFHCTSLALASRLDTRDALCLYA